MSYTRIDGRQPNELRQLSCSLGVQIAPTASVLLRWGNTHVLTSVTVEERVPSHRLASGSGWVTAEYNMLPGSGSGRIARSTRGVKGRTAEIQRLIGRSLRAVFNPDALPPITFTVDCDVINADGGTRCASITAGSIGMAMAMNILKPKYPSLETGDMVSAVRLGVLNGEVITDLCYHEDHQADVDLNVVATQAGIVEIQGTGETGPFSREHLDQMIGLGMSGCQQLRRFQQAVLSGFQEGQTEFVADWSTL